MDEKKEEVASDTCKELAIFISEKDRTGNDICAMSNFLHAHGNSLLAAVKKRTEDGPLDGVPAVDSAILLDVVNASRVLSEGLYSYVLDYESLPADVRKKLGSGEYRLGDSRQVDGNVRAVVVDGEGTRVKDVTLRRVRNDEASIAAAGKLAEHMQLRQIYEKVDEIHKLQAFQIDRDRDQAIVVPFRNARSWILDAQSSKDEDEGRRLLERAHEELQRGANSVYADMATVAEHLGKESGRFLFRRRDLVREYVAMLTEDLQLASQFLGVQLGVLGYLGKEDAAKNAVDLYLGSLRSFCQDPVGRRRLSAALLVHDNWELRGEHRNCWWDFAGAFEALPPDGGRLPNGKDVVLVSLEDSDEGED